MKGFNFYDPSSKSFFDTGNVKFIEDVENSGSSKLRNSVFEEKYVTIPIIGTKNDQVITYDIIQDANPDNQDTIELPLALIEEPNSFMRRNNNNLNWKCHWKDLLGRGERRFWITISYISKNKSLIWDWKMIQYILVKSNNL